MASGCAVPIEEPIMAAKRSTKKSASRATKSGRRKSGATKAKKKVAKKPAKKTTARKAAGASKAKKRTKAPARRQTAAEAQVEQIQRVIDVMVAAGAVEVELKEANSRLRVRLKEEPVSVAMPTAAPIAAAPHPVAAHDPAANSEPSAAPAAGAGALPEGEVFKSPMVGTFYRSPSPDAEPFVKEGDQVTEDSVLCIIEAMKVMNEIGSEMTGQIVAILAQNGEPVDYGQPLFVIKT